MRRILTSTLLPTLLILTALAAVPEKPEEGPLAHLEWLSGTWVHTEDGQYLEETWSPAREDALIGMFRWSRDGKVWLYELMSIEVEESGPVFRLRHFSRGLAPWKSEADGPMTYPMSSSGENEIVFEHPTHDQPRRFVYKREGDVLTVGLEGPEEGSGDAFKLKRLAD